VETGKVQCGRQSETNPTFDLALKVGELTWQMQSKHSDDTLTCCELTKVSVSDETKVQTKKSDHD
jgi:hypothetical protein